jgi:hypothetical protein
MLRHLYETTVDRYLVPQQKGRALMALPFLPPICIDLLFKFTSKVWRMEQVEKF